MRKKFFLTILTVFILFALTQAVGASSYGGMLSPAMKILSEDEVMIKSGLVSGSISFSEEDFTNSVGRSIDSITITALPPQSEGTLYYGAAPVSVNQSIGYRSLSELRFVPASDCKSSSFRFKSGAEYSIVCQITYTDTLNFSPVVSTSDDSLAVWTQSDITTHGKLYASDPEGDEMVYEIVDYPEKGIVSLTDKNAGNYIYTPCLGMSGKDSFTYRVRDCWGNYSSVAVCEIEIEKRDDSYVFADMDGHWAHNAALVMADSNAMEIRSVGGELYFDPDDNISREDFIVTVMKALGAGEIEPYPTSFEDDSAITSANKGYIARAAELGIIRGSEENGKMFFKPTECITRAEAAVVLNAIIGEETPSAVPVFADNSAVPAWAQSAMYALTGAGVFKGNGDGYISPNSTLTRGETAQILLTVIRNYS